jgi:hypothetical protein
MKIKTVFWFITLGLTMMVSFKVPSENFADLWAICGIWAANLLGWIEGNLAEAQRHEDLAIREAQTRCEK